MRPQAANYLNGWRHCFPTRTTQPTACASPFVHWLISAGTSIPTTVRQVYFRILRLPLVAITHAEKAKLALAVYRRYGGNMDDHALRAVNTLLEPDEISWSRTLGDALRLAETLSGGKSQLLAGSQLRLGKNRLTLQVDPSIADLVSDVVRNRFVSIGQPVAKKVSVRSCLIGARFAYSGSLPAAAGTVSEVPWRRRRRPERRRLLPLLVGSLGAGNGSTSPGNRSPSPSEHGYRSRPGRLRHVSNATHRRRIVLPAQPFSAATSALSSAAICSRSLTLATSRWATWCSSHLCFSRTFTQIG